MTRFLGKTPPHDFVYLVCPNCLGFNWANAVSTDNHNVSVVCGDCQKQVELRAITGIQYHDEMALKRIKAQGLKVINP